MSEQQPPPGYTPTPPTEPGWYRVWKVLDESSDQRVVHVWRSSKGDRELFFSKGYPMKQMPRWFWGPKVEF